VEQDHEKDQKAQIDVRVEPTFEGAERAFVTAFTHPEIHQEQDNDKPDHPIDQPH
jgi:hypothetical protein